MSSCLEASFEIRRDQLQTAFEIRRGNLQGRVGFVCGTSFTTPEGYEVLWVQDGMLLTIDGGRLYVRKNE